MIYRIAIYRTENGQRVFDHYATDEEMKYLRVNADGKVEKLNVNHGMAVYPPRFMVLQIDLDKQLGDNSFIPVYAQWLDVSSTHEVEWGFVQDEVSVYINDIVETSEGRSKVMLWGTKFVIDDELCLTCEYLEDIEFEVIGNVHENPELIAELGGKDE